MNAFNPHSRGGYGALIKEASAGTFGYPNVFFEVMSSTLHAEYPTQPIMSVVGKVDKNIRFAENKITNNGTISLYCEPRTLGYFLQNFFGNATTTELEASVSYLHEFQSSLTEPPTFTYEFKVAGGDYVHRFGGCRITKLEFAKEDNLIKVTSDIEALKSFTNARVKADASSGTTLTLDQTTGITTSDTILVLSQSDYSQVAELTVSSIDDENTLTVSTISASITENDIVVIKAQTPPSDYELLAEFIYHGGASYKAGTDIGNTECKNLEDFNFSFERDKEVFHSACGFDIVNRMPSAIKLKGLECKGNMKHYYDTEEFLDKLRAKGSFATRLECRNHEALGSNIIAQATLTIGSGDGFTVSATADGDFDGEAGNDLHLILEVNTTDDLAASISGNTITVKLANTTASNNTGTLIAAALDALTGIDGAADGAGTETFTTAVERQYLSGGRDANEEAALFIDMFDCNYEPFNVEVEEDGIVTQDMNYIASLHADGDDEGSTRVRVRNNITSYT